MARLLGIAIRTKARGEMVLLQRATVTLLTGVDNDFRGKPGKRQVTVLTREGWQAACADVGASLPWYKRRANLYIEGLVLPQTQGGILQIGALRLLITRETDPCNRMDLVAPGLFGALAVEWRGGVCCRVVAPGEVRVGDEVVLTGGD